jgi:GR25 family glycosyltransferase involved in LPS biosynthesis
MADNPLDYFDEICCLTLIGRKDRLDAAGKEFKKFNTTTLVSCLNSVPAMGGYAERETAAALSHIEVIEYAQTQGYNNVMVVEDDVQFHNRDQFQAVIDELKTVEWDLFYFGANICNTITQVSPHLGRLSHAQAMHAYAVNACFFDQFIALKSRVLARERELDCILAYDIVPKVRAFIAIPMLATQRPSFSNINQRYENYDWMFDRYNQWLRKTPFVNMV